MAWGCSGLGIYDKTWGPFFVALCVGSVLVGHPSFAELAWGLEAQPRRRTRVRKNQADMSYAS